MQKGAVSFGWIAKKVTSSSDPARLSAFSKRMAARTQRASAAADVAKTPSAASAAKRMANRVGVADESAGLQMAKLNPVRQAPAFNFPNPENLRFTNVPMPKKFPHGSADQARGTVQLRKPKVKMALDLASIQAFRDEVGKIAGVRS